ncbi:hypothetical protein IBE11_07935 [Francisella tularensis subsp. novicida]|uniref:hypothetical protein n=1 Tax=Francisella tularensis TaxID=263 RepID=UPI0005176510|nr:hypothetical protein [Francisella tularensis]MBK2345041.1 hypothetical protein [Francisella tularensis subsp. novicida]MBK2350394.1 hypothetical protein [Francisella tularensis subsp. novicida]MBK2353954.1 hypothetical protein [Francisella tularensis subsp. novicida]MBK2355749.1 hypothetical protein [Francisella tularensis subsp. novicida]MBK2359367.1 hypothetical protein [Francisella tularensis subsp. novicida]
MCTEPSQTIKNQVKEISQKLDDTKKLWSSPILAIKNRQLFEGKTFTESQESSFGADGPS